MNDHTAMQEKGCSGLLECRPAKPPSEGDKRQRATSVLEVRFFACHKFISGRSLQVVKRMHRLFSGELAESATGAEAPATQQVNPEMSIAASVRQALLCLLLCASPVAHSAPALSPAQQRLLEFHVRDVVSQTSGHRGGDAVSGFGRWAEIKAGQLVLPLAASTADGEAPVPQELLDGISSYLAQQPITALLIAKNGRLVVERYQYGASPSTWMLSNSMAKSLTGIAMGVVEGQGAIKSLDDPTSLYLPSLSGHPSGQTTLRNHLRMGSGIRFRQDYSRGDDNSAFTWEVETRGILAALARLNGFEHEPGKRFYYANHSSAALAAVVEAASGRRISDLFSEAVWAPMGAESAGAWRVDGRGLALGHCCVLARARDYLRLGIILANGGVRPDTGQRIIPAAFMNRLGDIKLLQPSFKPPLSGDSGYESQFWISAGVPGAFFLLGSHGQGMFIYPASQLVVLHLAVNEPVLISGSTMAQARLRLLDVIRRYLK